jgi:hypothetical protein
LDTLAAALSEYQRSYSTGKEGTQQSKADVQVGKQNLHNIEQGSRLASNESRTSAEQKNYVQSLANFDR